MRLITSKKILLISILAVYLFPGCTESPIYRGGERSRAGRARTVTPQPAPHPEKGFFTPPVYNLRRSRISSWFGVRKDPRYNIREFHKGIDIRARPGEAVMSAAPGVIEFAGKKNGFGKVIIISHSKGFHTVYAHLATILCGEGEQVARGEKIGRAGRSGNATGVHLHFEIRKYSKALDPSLFLDL